VAEFDDDELEGAVDTLLAALADESGQEHPSGMDDEDGISANTDEEREREVVENIRRMLQDAEQGKNILSDEAAQNILRYQRGPAGNATGKSWRADPQVNLQKSALELAIATRNDQEMGWNVRGRDGPGSDLVAGLIQAMMREAWSRSAMKEKRIDITFSGGVYGGAVIKTVFENATAEHPGRNVIKVVDLRTCVADPHSSDNDDLQASGYWIELPMLGASQIYVAWPTDIRGRDVSELLEDLMSEPSEAESVSREMGHDLFMGEFEHRYPADSAKDRFLLVEAWYPDQTMTTEDVFDERTNTSVDANTGVVAASYSEKVKVGTRRVQKYPYGRLSIAILPQSGDPIVLVDEPNRYRHIPVVYHQEGIDPTRLIGISMFSDTNNLADMLSNTLGYIADFTQMQAFPKLIIDITRLPEGLEVSDSPGEMLESNGDVTGAAAYLSPGSMAVEVFRFMDIVRRLLDDLTGQYEVSKGQKPPSVTAAQAIEAIQSVAMLRPKLKNAMLALSLERVAKQMLDNMVNFGGYDKRWLSLSGEEGRRLYDRIEAYRQQKLQESVGPQGPTGPTDASSGMAGLPDYISDVVAYSPDGSPNPSEFHIAYIAKHLKAAAAGIEIEIEVNTPQTQSKVGRAEQALAIAPLKDENGKSLVPPEYILRALDIPHADQIIAQRQAENNAQAILADIQPKYEAAVQALRAQGVPLPWETPPQNQGQVGAPQGPI